MKNIQNATQNQEKTQDTRDKVVKSAGKVWEEPSITEISRFAILSGGNGGKNEGITLDGSA